MAKHIIAALILTYNDSDLTTQLCNCLHKQDEIDWIVVVDNSDNLIIQAVNADAVPAIGLNVAYIKAPANEGYAAGNNIGINYILKNTDAEYIWIINNDIIPQKNAALFMIDELQAYNNKAICGSVLLYYNGKDVPDETTTLQCYGGGIFYSFIGKSKLALKNLPLSALKDNKKKDVDFIMGASMMVHKNIFNEVGLLPEEYFMYLEELDWQTVAKKHNYKLIIAESSLVFHLDSLSTKNKRHAFYFLLNRASVIFTKKYYKRFLPGVLLFRTIEAIAFVPGKQNKLSSLKGLYNGLVSTKKEIKIIKALLSHAKAYNSYNEVAGIIDKRGEQRFVICFLNMFAIQTALKNEEFFNALMQSDLLLYDGIGVKLLCNRYNIPYGINMNGTDFIPWLLDKFKSKSLLVFASSFTAVSKFREKLSDHNILHIEDGFKNYDDYIAATIKYPYEIILLGMGMPKQELLASQIKSPGIIVNGGAIVDYLSGIKKRAPKVFIKLNAEWLYRILYEPKRLFTRYFSGIILMTRIGSN